MTPSYKNIFCYIFFFKIFTLNKVTLFFLPDFILYKSCEIIVFKSKNTMLVKFNKVRYFSNFVKHHVYNTFKANVLLKYKKYLFFMHRKHVGFSKFCLQIVKFWQWSKIKCLSLAQMVAFCVRYCSISSNAFCFPFSHKKFLDKLF